MADPIALGEFMRVNGMDPRTGLRGPMMASGDTSLRAFVRSHTPDWTNIIRTFFRHDDIHHMRYGSPEGIPADPFDLEDYTQTRERARAILRVVSSTDGKVRMPPPPDAPWGLDIIALFHRWVAGGTPR